MSILVHAKADKERITAMLFSVVRELTFHAIDEEKKKAVAQVFTAHQSAPYLDVQCSMRVKHGKSMIVIELAEALEKPKTN